MTTGRDEVGGSGRSAVLVCSGWCVRCVSPRRGLVELSTIWRVNTLYASTLRISTQTLGTELW